MKARLILLLFCACYFPLVAQLSFDSYSKKDGLTSNEMTVSLVDTRGIVWIGTSNGLNAYSNAKWYAKKISKKSSQESQSLLGG